MNSLKISLLVLLISASLLLPSDTQTTRSTHSSYWRRFTVRRCDPDNRPEVCTAIYDPVCAHVDDCTGADCWFTAGSPCSACANSTVDYYRPGGECIPAGARRCNATDRPEVCPAIYDPVCAHIADCTGNDCWETAASSCNACANSDVDYYEPGGACAGDDSDTDNGSLQECDLDNRPEVCTFIYNPVCAHNSSCSGFDCWVTEGNPCTACANSDVDFYEPGGECGDSLGECDPDNRPEICTAIYAPVCAHIADCSGNNCWFTAASNCTACGNSTVDVYRPNGEC